MASKWRASGIRPANWPVPHLSSAFYIGGHCLVSVAGEIQPTLSTYSVPVYGPQNNRSAKSHTAANCHFHLFITSIIFITQLQQVTIDCVKLWKSINRHDRLHWLNRGSGIAIVDGTDLAWRLAKYKLKAHGCVPICVWHPSIDMYHPTQSLLMDDSPSGLTLLFLLILHMQSISG